MKNDRQEHRRCRNDLGFDAHRAGRFSGEMWNDRCWRFSKAGPDVFDPHCREISRTPSVPGKHMRRMREQARVSHGK
jgi:hypothetical protein